MSSTVRNAGKRPSPPFGREAARKIRSDRDGSIDRCVIVGLDLKLDIGTPNIVLPSDHDPSDYDLDFLAGETVVIAHEKGHPAAHVDAAWDAIRAVGPRLCGVFELPDDRIPDGESGTRGEGTPTRPAGTAGRRRRLHS